MKVRIAGIQESLRDSEGISQTIYYQGCILNCPGCSNPILQDYNGGTELSLEEVLEWLESIIKWDNDLVHQGGEPTEQKEALIEICKWAHNKGLKNWIYTGKLFKDIDDDIKEHADVIIDGPYIQDLKPTRDFRGSDNQSMYHKIDGVWDNGDN